MRLPEINIAAAFVPIDMAAGANSGKWISLKNFGRLTIVLFKAVGIGGDIPIFTLNQATAVAGTGSKALNFTRIFKKAGANVGAIGPWTIITQAAANTYSLAADATLQAIYAVEILPEDLDVNNNFDCVQLLVPDVGAGGAQLGCAFYLLSEPRVTPNVDPYVD